MSETPVQQLPPPPCVKREPGSMSVRVKVEAFEPCPIHAPTPCDCPKVCTGVVDKGDLMTKQFAQFVRCNLLNQSDTITDTGGTGRAISANSAATVPTVCAGTGSTAATVADTNLVTQTETQSATVGTYSGSGSSGTFTVTGTITAGALRAYQEVGLKITVGGNTFLVCRDTFTTLNVSSGGTLAVTYTLTFQ